MTFSQRVAMTLRWATLEVVAGVVFIAMGTYGLVTYKPIPDDAPYASPIPFEALFCLGILFGAVVVVWAHLKANRE